MFERVTLDDRVAEICGELDAVSDVDSVSELVGLSDGEAVWNGVHVSDPVSVAVAVRFNVGDIVAVKLCEGAMLRVLLSESVTVTLSVRVRPIGESVKDAERKLEGVNVTVVELVN